MTRRPSASMATSWPAHHTRIRRWNGRPQARVVAATPRPGLSIDDRVVPPRNGSGAVGAVLQHASTTSHRTEVWLEIGLATMIIVAIGLLALSSR